MTVLHTFWHERPTLNGTSQAETMQKPMSGQWPKEPLHQVYLSTSLCWKKVFMMNSTLLEHSCSGSLLLSLTSASPCRPITPFHTPESFPTCALKSPKRIVDTSVLTLRKASLLSSTNSRYRIFRRISRGQFLALKMRDFPYYRLISRIRKFRYLTLSGMRYIHYAPTHVLYNGGDAGHGVVGSSKLLRAQKLTVLVRGFACESTRSAAPA